VTKAANEIICALQKMNTIRKLGWNATIKDDILPSLKSEIFSLGESYIVGNEIDERCDE